MENSDLKSYIEKIESITPDPKNDYYNNTFKNAVGTAKENLEYLQPNEKSQLLGLLNQKINRALNIGYTLT